MIPVQTVHDRMLSALDAQDSDRYLFDPHIKDAINGAVEDMVTLLDYAFGANKLSPEKLVDLTFVKVFKTNSYSRFAFKANEVGHDYWTVLAIYPKPIVNKKVTQSPSSTPTSVSSYAPDVSFINGGKAAKRLTFEQWTDNEDNAFMPGNDILQGASKEYAYLDAADFSSSSYTGNGGYPEWTIRPAVPTQYVAFAYLKRPSTVTQITDNLEFPKSVTDLIVDLALQKITYKQGAGGAPLYAVTTQNVNRLIAAIK